MKKVITFLLLCLFAINTFAQELMNEKKSISGKEFTIKVTQTEKGKLKAVFESVEDPSKSLETFTNHITIGDFKLQLQSFTELLTDDTLTAALKAEANKIAMALYATLPTEATSKDAEDVAVVLHIKKTIPVDTGKVQIQSNPKVQIINLLNDFIGALNYHVMINDGKPLVFNEGTKEFVRKTAPVPATAIFFSNKQYEIPITKNQTFYSEPIDYKPTSPYLGKFQLTDAIPSSSGKLQVTFDTADVSTDTVPGRLKGKITYEVADRGSLAFMVKLKGLKATLNPQVFNASSFLDNISEFKNSYSKEWDIIKRAIDVPLFDLNYKDFAKYHKQMEGLESFADNSLKAELDLIKTANSLREIFEASEKIDGISASIEALPKEKTSDKNFYKSESAKLWSLQNTFSNFLSDYTNDQNMLEVDSVEFTIKDGFMQDIKVKGMFMGKKYKFENIFPIGYSSKYNFKDINKHHLFENFKENPNPKQYQIALSDLFPMHDYNIDTDTKDYSPDDQKVVAVLTTPEKEVPLTRDKTKEIIDMRIFTDLFGIGKNEPNGLAQVEIGHKFKLNTLKTQMGKARTSIGGLEYIRLSGLISKIENKERELNLTTVDSLVNGKIASVSFAPFIGFYKYQSFHFAVDMNLLAIGVPDAKSAFQINGGVHYVGTFVKGQRSILENGTIAARKDTFTDFVGNLIVQPEAKWEIAENQRIGGFLAYRANFMFSLNKDYYYSNTQNFESKSFGVFHTVGGEFFYKPVNKDKLFLRANFNWQTSLLKQHYVQIQVGYLLNIFKKETK